MVLGIQVLDAFLAPGSELWMFNDVPEIDRERKLIDGGLDFSRLENIALVHREGNAVIRRDLESLPLESFDSISFEQLYCTMLELLTCRIINAKICSIGIIAHLPCD
jgi:hypothetical protein